MSKAQKFLGPAIALLVFGLGGWALFRFVYLLSEINSSVQAAIIAGVVALATVIFTFWKERTRSIKEAHREQKIAAYSIFYDIIFGLMEKNKRGENIDFEGEEFQKQFFGLMRNILFYGSPEVVKAFSDWKRFGGSSSDGNLDGIKTFKLIGKILLVMRADIGLSNRGLDEMNIHQIYVTDDLALLGSER